MVETERERERERGLLTFPSGVPLIASYPGSLNIGSGMKIIPWIERSTCNIIVRMYVIEM